MIHTLKGILIGKTEKTIFFSLFSSTIAFEIFVINPDYFSLNSEYLLYINMFFSSEKGYSLYGFLEEEQRNYFLILQDCHGISVKIALLILSSLSVEKIYTGILAEDKKLFESISGIGKKKAEMIILELKSKISKIPPIKNADLFLNYDDLINALKVLGYNQKEINNMINSLYNMKLNKDLSLVQLIEKALIVNQ